MSRDSLEKEPHPEKVEVLGQAELHKKVAELSAENVRYRVALMRIEQMPWPKSESPYAKIARKALKASSVPSGTEKQLADSSNPNS